MLGSRYLYLTSILRTLSCLLPQPLPLPKKTYTAAFERRYFKAQSLCQAENRVLADAVHSLLLLSMIGPKHVVGLTDLPAEVLSHILTFVALVRISEHDATLAMWAPAHFRLLLRYLI